MVAVHLPRVLCSERALARRWSVQSWSISALNKLAVEDCSQNDPVIRCPVALQNMIQPTPDKSAAFFLS